MTLDLAARIALKIEHDLTSEMDLPEDVLDALTYALRPTPHADSNCTWHDERGLSFRAYHDLDLYGSLHDPFHDSIEFTHVSTLVVLNASEDDCDVRVGGAASNPFDTWVADGADSVVVTQDGFLVLHSPVDPYAVTPGSGDILRVTREDLTKHATYRVLIWGTESEASMSRSMSRSASASRSRSMMRSGSKSASRSASASQSKSVSKMP